MSISQLVTIQQLKRLAPYARTNRLRDLIGPINEALTHYEINTPLRIAAFLAQTAHESGSFNYLTEIASGRAYEGRNNYKRYTGLLKINFLTNPEWLGTPYGAVQSAACFWQTHGINQYADVGDFKRITKIINGGYNHLEERQTFYERAREIFGVEKETN